MSRRNWLRRAIFSLSMVYLGYGFAQTPASVPYTPSWTARHYLHWLIDHEGLNLTVSQWPLPAAVVEQALDELRSDDSTPGVMTARNFVKKELEALKSSSLLSVHARSDSEGLNGYGDNHTPGSSARLSSPEIRRSWGSVSAAGKLGIRADEVPNERRGLDDTGPHRWSLDGSAAVLNVSGWQLQAFSHRHWWGPGWQSSLINGHNQPGWTGVGIQRGETKPSQNALTSWLGPWNLDVFVAKAQDPLVVENQPQGFLFSGIRLTVKPKPWLEIGLSRGLQTAGKGRPGGAGNFVKAFLGQEVNKNPDDTFIDSSAQLAGYDVRLSCPRTWAELLGTCAAYTQWIGEDAAGKLPLPFKFMSLWGVESSYGQGRYRVFAEWSDTNAYSLPWDTKPTFPGYLNGVYVQGYTQGTRWVGSAQGGGSRVFSMGWMDAAKQRLIKLHMGQIHTALGAYNPSVKAPNGQFKGLSASQTIVWKNFSVMPELAVIRFAQGHTDLDSKRQHIRLGLDVVMTY